MFGEWTRLAEIFSQPARAIAVTSTGARLAGIYSTLVKGDTVGLQAGNKRGRFRVVCCTPESGQVDLEGIKTDEDFWTLSLADLSSPVPAPQPKIRAEHRSHKRYEIAGTAAVRPEGSTATYDTVLTDIGLGGCYLQSLSPLPVNAPVNLDISLVGYSFQVCGVVRICHPHMGMGIKFTGEPNAKLMELLGEVEAGHVSATRSARLTKPNSRRTPKRLQSFSEELRDLDQLIQGAQLDPAVLRQFRDALDAMRNTAWAIEQYMLLHAESETAVPQLKFLNSERMRLATQFCRSLVQQGQTASVDAAQLQQFTEAVADLIYSAKPAPARRQ